MKEYMISVFVSCAVLGLLTLLLYREGGEGASKFAFGVLLLFTVTMPLADFSLDMISSIGSIKYPSFSENGAEEVTKAAFEEGVKKLIEEEADLPSGAVFVVADGFSHTEMRAVRIRVYLSGKGAFADKKAVERIVEKYGLGECYAEYEI